eukprot:scaffold417_cov252-Pinguiococcus_pyrenoidosus.AAC.21
MDPRTVSLVVQSCQELQEPSHRLLRLAAAAAISKDCFEADWRRPSPMAGQDGSAARETDIRPCYAEIPTRPQFLSASASVVIFAAVTRLLELRVASRLSCRRAHAS